jgi:glyoxylase-like metal-dependent hydrolase (beta-lactamase superfamily II)
MEQSMTRIHRIEVPIPFPLKTVSCYYILDSIPTLIDTGVNSAAGLDIIERKIRSVGGRLSDLKRIILTHGHTDHVGLAGKIASHSGAADIFLALSEAIGHLDYLRSKGMADMQWRKEVRVYRWKAKIDKR